MSVKRPSIVAMIRRSESFIMDANCCSSLVPTGMMVVDFATNKLTYKPRLKNCYKFETVVETVMTWGYMNVSCQTHQSTRAFSSNTRKSRAFYGSSSELVQVLNLMVPRLHCESVHHLNQQRWKRSMNRNTDKLVRTRLHVVHVNIYCRPACDTIQTDPDKSTQAVLEFIRLPYRFESRHVLQQTSQTYASAVRRWSADCAVNA